MNVACPLHLGNLKMKTMTLQPNHWLLKIPWFVAKRAYIAYAMKYTDRTLSLKKIDSMGGFTTKEMDEFYPDWRKDAYWVNSDTNLQERVCDD